MSLILSGNSGSMTVDSTAGVTFPAGGNPQAAPSKVLQVVNAVFTSTVTTSSTTFVTSGVTASITPLFSTSKIYVIATVNADTQGIGQQAGFTIYRNSTNLGTGAANNALGFAWGTSSRVIGCVTIQSLDSPATTSSTTYTVYMNSENGGSIQIGNSSGSTITLMEIAA